jgi:hypothetical protein
VLACSPRNGISHQRDVHEDNQPPAYAQLPPASLHLHVFTLANTKVEHMLGAGAGAMEGPGAMASQTGSTGGMPGGTGGAGFLRQCVLGSPHPGAPTGRAWGVAGGGCKERERERIVRGR